MAPEVRGAQPFHGLTDALAGALRLAAAVFAALALTACLASAAPPDASELRATHEDKPSFKLPDSTGAEIALSAHRGRGVLVHFFATWCEPCREELPALRRLVERAGDRKLDVVAISVAEVPIRVRRFLEQMPVNFSVLLDEDRAVSKAWGVHTLPTTFVLDSELKARLAVEREYDWDRLDVASLLEQLSKERE